MSANLMMLCTYRHHRLADVMTTAFTLQRVPHTALKFLLLELPDNWIEDIMTSESMRALRTMDYIPDPLLEI